jgi:hypothetical protein
LSRHRSHCDRHTLPRRPALASVQDRDRPITASLPRRRVFVRFHDGIDQSLKLALFGAILDMPRQLSVARGRLLAIPLGQHYFFRRTHFGADSPGSTSVLIVATSESA